MYDEKMRRMDSSSNGLMCSEGESERFMYR